MAGEEVRVRLSLSRQADHAVRAMVWLAAQPSSGRRKAAEIAEAVGIPPAFAARVLAQLNRAGAPPPRAPSRPIEESSPFTPGPLFAVLGVLALLLMALMVATNYVLAQQASAPARAAIPVVASGPAGTAGQVGAGPVSAAAE